MTLGVAFNRTVNIAKDADVALVIVVVRELAKQIDLSEVRATRLATAASELATNIAKYARWGTLTLRAGETKSRRFVTILARDKGPGIADLQAALQDHYSTGGSLGLGLPGVRRLMDEVDFDNEPGRGCVITARMWLDD